MNTPSFIAVEGPIGVGKTSLAAALAQHQDSFLLEEIVDENPFLHKFYENIADWSFQTEMFFLCNRYKQLQDAGKYMRQAGNTIVADYHIFKNLIFAKKNLPAAEFEKYEQIYQILTKDLVMPNMVIYLTAELDTLLKRIAGRGRQFEEQMDPSYLAGLIADYDRFIDHFERTCPEVPVIRIDTNPIDFVHNQTDLHNTLSSILEYR